MRMSFVAAVVCACVVALAACNRQEPLDYSWTPDRQINIIVPWAAGGATDQVIRRAASDIEQALRRSVVVVNMPGGSGSIGTGEALNAPADGYTWTSGSAASLGIFPVLGMLDTNIDDWHLFLAVANIPVISVHPDSEYEDFGDLLADLRARPGQVRVATAGTASTGHKVIELICQAADTSYRHISYDGGNPAVISVVQRESDLTPQLASEQADMIRGGRLRPLAVFADQSIELDGYGEVPPITNWLPEAHMAMDYFGIWVRKGVPDEVIETMEEVWDEYIVNSERLQEFARERGAIMTPYYGDEARERVWQSVRTDAWVLYDIGQAAVSPDTLGIPRPE
jgi:tripartite-type tricarboxylate transporter receptor subunit TctC